MGISLAILDIFTCGATSLSLSFRTCIFKMLCFKTVLHSGKVTREPTLRAFCFENSAKQSLLHWAGGSKPVSKGLKEEAKQPTQNVVRE